MVWLWAASCHNTMILYPSRVALRQSSSASARHVVRSLPSSFADVRTAVSHPAMSVHSKVLTVFHVICRQSLRCKRFDLRQVAAVCKPRSCRLQDDWRTHTAVKRPAHTRHALLLCLPAFCCNVNPEAASKQETAHKLYILGTLCNLPAPKQTRHKAVAQAK